MEPVVKTRQGIIRGSIINDLMSFKGIPYAAAPFGPNRLRPPQPATPWAGEREVFNFGPTAPKGPFAPPLDKLIPENDIPGEDCLNLNIWTPALGQAHLPVMVWIHGGGFTNGTGSLAIHDGTHFARDGVVCVTLNYRLGVEGFLYLDDGLANLGLLDQIAALTWVQDNISAFGGDPNNVTIFGESAGAMSISTLMAMPVANGLFRRAIAQSGAGHHVVTAATALRIGQYFAEKLGVEPTRESIGKVPMNRLIQVQQALVADLRARLNPDLWGEVLENGMPFEPVIDGELLTSRPIDILAAGKGAKVDILVGSNSDEMHLFLIPSGMINLVNEDFLAGTIAPFGLPIEETLAAYRTTYQGKTPGELLSAIMTDWFFRIPTIRLAEAQIRQNSGSAYLYEFAWRSPAFDGRIGACHAMDLEFVFDNLHLHDMEELLGTNPPQQIADAMHAAWVAFARSGDPGWPRYDLIRRATMRFDITSGIVEDPGGVTRLLWEGRR
jgi:para-nitrobenzyl esterase